MRKIPKSDIIGKKFGKLSPKEETKKHGGRFFLCVCDCGKKKEVLMNNLRRGLTSSCGCEKKNNSLTHGMFGTRPYSIWHGIKRRCNDKKHNRYKDWGGRGISYDPKWETFIGFWEDMSEGYADSLTIDRIDNDGNYCKENCRWSTYKEQCKNKRK